MKTLFVGMLVVAITGCGTIGGTISGAGKDLSRAGGWIQSQ